MEKKKKNVLLDGCKEILDNVMQTLEKKNADYAGNEDPFKNFRNSIVVGVDPRKAILVRVMDKISRVSNLIDKGIETGEVKDESIYDTQQDIIGYMAILSVMTKKINEGLRECCAVSSDDLEKAKAFDIEFENNQTPGSL